MAHDLIPAVYMYTMSLCIGTNSPCVQSHTHNKELWSIKNSFPFYSHIMLKQLQGGKKKYRNFPLTGFLRKNKDSAPIKGISPSRGSNITLIVP